MGRLVFIEWVVFNTIAAFYRRGVVFMEEPALYKRSAFIDRPFLSNKALMKVKKRDVRISDVPRRGF